MKKEQMVGTRLPDAVHDLLMLLGIAGRWEAIRACKLLVIGLFDLL